MASDPREARESLACDVRTYVRRVDGEPWADAISDEHLATLAINAKVRLSTSGKTRGWLGEVHAILKREREAVCPTCGGEGAVCCGDRLPDGRCCETLDGGDVGRPCPDCGGEAGSRVD